MTEPVSYNDLAAFFSSNFGSTCETKSRIDRFYQDREINYLECTTPNYGLSTFTVTLDGINSFADLTCQDYSQMSSKNVFTCESMQEHSLANFEIAFEKLEDGALRAVGGFIDAESHSNAGRSFFEVPERAGKLLDFLGSVDLGWYWVTSGGGWFAMESGIWQQL